jgi:hypothetical protein
MARLILSLKAPNATREVPDHKGYPPRQTPGSFNLEKVQKMIEDAASGR